MAKLSIIITGNTENRHITLDSLKDQGVLEESTVLFKDDLSHMEIETPYLFYMRSGDTLKENTLKNAVSFLDTHEETDLVSFPVFTEGKADLQNYKYKETCVIDLAKKRVFGNRSLYNCVLRTAALKEVSFYENDPEGTLTAAEIQLKKNTEGVLKEGGVFHIPEKEGYLPKLERYLSLLELTKKMNGKTELWIQHMVLHDLRWYITGEKTDEETGKLIHERVTALLQKIDDLVICGLMNASKLWQIFYLKMKYQRDITEECTYDPKKERVLFHNYDVYDPFAYNRADIVFLYRRKDRLCFEGLTDVNVLGDMWKVCVRNSSGITEEGKLSVRPFWNLRAVDGTEVYTGAIFKMSIRVKKNDELHFFLKNGDNEVPAALTFRDRAALQGGKEEEFPGTYCILKDFLLKHPSADTVTIEPAGFFADRKAEKEYCEELIRRGREDLVELRKKFFLFKRHHRRPIWIVADRVYRGRDNGEAFFRYASGNRELKKTHEIVYLLDKNITGEYERIRQYGKIIDPAEEETALYLLAARAEITSVTTSFSPRSLPYPLNEDLRYLKDLRDYNYVYLKHGIILEDSSVRLHRMQKFFDLLVTAADREYQDVLTRNYGYTEEEVKCTGLARYDLLHQDQKEKLVVFLPTWRQYAAGDEANAGREFSRNPHFKETEYYQFYQSLISDERILEVMKRKGYRGEFYAHPGHRNNASDFVPNEIITMPEKNADYNHLFNTGSLFISDYSSAVLDVAYLKKPIIYAQFDREKFFATHIYGRGSYDYEKDGFGPVCYDYESTVKEIISALERDCRNDPVYEERSERFFRYHDQRNCERIVKEILKKEEEE